MRKLSVLLFAGFFLLLGASAAWAPCSGVGYVYCDVDTNGVYDEGVDTPFEGIGVYVNGVLQATTNSDGYYYIGSLCDGTSKTISIDVPSDAVLVFPATNAVGPSNDPVIWLIDSPTCHSATEGDCWLTAGGVKFERLINGGERVAQGGPKDSVGGVAYPSCSPFPSNGGQWNHVAHSIKMHLIGKDITVIRCGNVPGIDPGSESPVCPVNFIEFEGSGVVKGIHGNKMEDLPVWFFVRAEDRNEPGNEQALNSTDGEDIDRYFLRVEDGGGNLVFQVDVNGTYEGLSEDPGFIVDPLTITGGNFQIHCTSCD